MAITLHYLGWSAFELTLEDGRRLLIDPLLSGCPNEGVPPSPVSIEEITGADVILVTHAAQDHVGETFEIMRRGKARLVCDVATRFLAVAAGLAPERILSMVPGVRFDLGRFFVKALSAHHLSFRQLTETSFISAPPLSYIVTSPGGIRIFFGGDTAISADHRLFGELYKPHVAILGVGGIDVMGQSLTELYPDEAARVAKWLGVKVAIPIHYRLDEGIVFAKELRRRAPKARAVVLKAGDTFTFPSGRPLAAKRV